MMKNLLRTIILGIAVFATTTIAAQEVSTSVKPSKKVRQTISLGEEIPRDTVGKKHHRGLKQHLIIPKGEWQIGAQISHVSLSSSNSEFMLLINGLDANASMTKIAPFFAYSYHNNRSIGVRFQYTTASGGVSKGELDLLSDDLNFEVENLRADLTSFQASIYHRSYLGLDNKGRIGVFADIALSYANNKNVFSYSEDTRHSFARTHQLKLGLFPGVVIFPMNNISTHVSMGIGGVSYNHTDYVKDGQVIGSRDFSKANFKLDVLDISIGLTIHL